MNACECTVSANMLNYAFFPYTTAQQRLGVKVEEGNNSFQQGFHTQVGKGQTLSW